MLGVGTTILGMAMRRKGDNPADDDNAGWIMDRLGDGTPIRMKVYPERIDRLSGHHRTILAERLVTVG